MARSVSISRRIPNLDLNEAGASGITGNPLTGYQYDIDQDKDVAKVGAFGADANRAKLEGVYDEIDGVYQELVAQGKRSQAFALRDAADKFRTTGAKYGVNSFRRTRALKDLEGSLNIASQGQQAKLMQQRLGDLRGTIGQLSQMSNTSFAQSMQRADFRERKLESLRGAKGTIKTTRSSDPRRTKSSRSNPLSSSFNARNDALLRGVNAQRLKQSEMRYLTKQRAKYYNETLGGQDASNQLVRTATNTPIRGERTGEGDALAASDVMKLWNTPSGTGPAVSEYQKSLSRSPIVLPSAPSAGGGGSAGGGNFGGSGSVDRIGLRRSGGGGSAPIPPSPQGQQYLLNRDTIAKGFTQYGNNYTLNDPSTLGGVYTDPVTGKRSIRASSRRYMEKMNPITR